MPGRLKIPAAMVEAQAAGYKLTTFATGFSHIGNTSTGVGPGGIAFAPGGVVLVGTWPGDLYRLPSHHDGQTMTNANIVVNTGVGTWAGLATLGNRVYEADRTNHSLYEVTTTNNFASVDFTPFGQPLGNYAADLRTNYATGKLLVSTASGIIEVDPTTGTNRVVNPQSGGDGMTINDSGTIVYLAQSVSGHVLGFNIKTGAQTFDSGYISNQASSFGIDGIALGTGALSRTMFVNNNGGVLSTLDLDTKVLTTIGLFGSRGDFVTVDPTDGSMFITQSDRILHLTAPTGSGFGGSIPEPSSYVLLGLGLIGLGFIKRRQRLK